MPYTRKPGAWPEHAAAKGKIMPIVTITLRSGRTPQEKDKILAAVNEALSHAFKIPEHDRFQRLLELPADDFEISPKRTDKFILIEIDAFPGRSNEAKRKLFARLAENFEGLGHAPDDFICILREPDLENWCVREGKPATDIKFGFEVKI